MAEQRTKVFSHTGTHCRRVARRARELDITAISEGDLVLGIRAGGGEHPVGEVGWELVYNDELTARKWALNSAVECHLHTVEVIGSNPIAPTIRSCF